ncbi:MAG: Acetyl-coenzyme A synthetase [Methanoregulaceae archaeon PtaB.Bin009]|jgi:acetyl-CoA synthetase|nr:MAG: Acetyl-coenzyme A synthetase [Methanoregulaceae archaeon PtaB.Bin009]OPY42089.1 MAG: Acetyl-coenzyme A synthetase [Methanoregulaceae archaeon PtaU1.Bin066]HNQ29033.1 acetate--CoA ligase [Methanolinea sp.]HNS82419.1 acetate--CoA ligase [Methanolinea sp.]
MAESFEVPLSGDEKTYIPDPSYKQNAWTKDYTTAYKEFMADPDGFWEKQAHHFEWIRKWDRVLEWNYPYAKWFVNAKLNITANCLDRHVNNHRRNKVALIWRGEEGEERTFTYKKLFGEVCRFANGLKKLGVAKGDRVCIYMPLVPEQVIAMLACARIGAVHSVVFGGFGVQALNMRIKDAEAKIVITADVTYRRGKTIPLKTIVEEAVINAPSVEKVVVLSREVEQPVEIHKEMEVDYFELMEGVPTTCEAEVMDAEDPLFILYTSGSTGTPKGIVHTCAGYMVGTAYTTQHVFDVKDNDVYWCTADTGWITGHSYVVYGPLAIGATIVLAEAVPDYPDAGAFWKIVEDLGVTIFYTAPTAIRMFMKVGEQWPNKYDLSSLRILGSVGEPLNPEAFEWYYQVIGKKKCPIVDTWWQTETGMQMITTMVGEPMRPGFAGRPIPGVVADVVDKKGKPVAPGNGGFLVIQRPWPAMLRTVYKNDERYRTYWNTIPDCYTAGDLAVKAKGDEYIMIIGRADDIIIVAGHNIGTAEVESALVSHQSVAEAAVIGKPEPMKGNIIKAFVILRVGFSPSEKLKSDLIYHVRMTLGPIAMPSEIEFVDKLPKTRSGKIMRRVLKAQEMGIDPGDVSTLEE